MKVFIITATGFLKNFPSSTKTYTCTKCYKNYPPQEAIENFKQNCCNSKNEDPKSLFDLEENCKIKIKELELIEN